MAQRQGIRVTPQSDAFSYRPPMDDITKGATGQKPTDFGPKGPVDSGMKQVESAFLAAKNFAVMMNSAMMNEKTLSRDTVDRELDRIFEEREEREEYHEEIRQVGEDAERAQELRDGGDQTGSEQAAAVAIDRAEGLAEVVPVVRMLHSSAAPADIITAVRSAIAERRQGETQEQRSDFRAASGLLTSMGRFYAEHAEALRSPEMAGTRERIEGMLRSLGGLSRPGGSGARELAERAGRLMESALREVRESEAGAVRGLASDCQRLLSGAHDDGLRRGIEQLRSELSEAGRRMLAGERVGPDALRLLRERVALAREALTFPAPIQAIFSRGLSALQAGRMEEAEAHRALATLAAGSEEASRPEIGRQSSELAAGRTTVAAVTSFMSSRISSALAPLIGRDGIQNQTARGVLGRMMNRLSGGRTGLGDMRAFSFAAQAGRSVLAQERRIASLPPSGRQAASRALEMYNRALSALEAGAPFEIASLLMELGGEYEAAGPEARREIDSRADATWQPSLLRSMEALVSNPDQALRLTPQAAARRILGSGASAAEIRRLVAAFSGAGSSPAERMASIERMERVAAAPPAVTPSSGARASPPPVPHTATPTISAAPHPAPAPPSEAPTAQTPAPTIAPPVRSPSTPSAPVAAPQSPSQAVPVEAPVQAPIRPPAPQEARSQIPDERLAYLREAAAGLRGHGHAPEGSARWFGERALAALESGEAQSAALAVAMGILQSDAHGGARHYIGRERYEAITGALARGAIPSAEIARYSALIETAAIQSDIDSLSREFPHDGTGARRESRHRVREAARVARERLASGDVEGTRRICGMAREYGDMLHGRHWRQWAGRSGMEAGLDAEIAGSDGTDAFERGLSSYEVSRQASQYRTALRRWGAALSPQRQIIESALQHAEELAASGETDGARSLLAIAVMYGDTVAGASIRRGTVPRALDQHFDPATMEGMARAMDSLAQGRNDPSTFELFMGSYNASQQAIITVEAERLEGLAASRPEGREQVMEALHTVRERAASGDLRGADLLLRYVTGYYGEASRTRREGWRYELETHPGVSGYRRGRQAILEAFGLEERAQTEEGHLAAAQRFDQGTGTIAETESIQLSLAHLRRTYMGLVAFEGMEREGFLPLGQRRDDGTYPASLPLEEVRGYEAAHPDDPVLAGGPALESLLEDCTGAADRGEREYETAVERFNERLSLVVGRLLELRNADQAASQLDQLHSALDGMMAPYVTGERETSESLETRATRMDATSSSGRRHGAPRIQTEPTYLEGSSERREAVRDLRLRIMDMRQRLDHLRETGGEFPFEEYAGLLSDAQRERRLAMATAEVTQQIRLNEQYRQTIAGESGPLRDSAVRHLDDAQAALQRARGFLLAGDATHAMSEYQSAIEARTSAMVAYSAERTSDVTVPVSLVEGLRPYTRMHIQAFRDIIDGTVEPHQIERRGHGLTIMEASVFSVPSHAFSESVDSFISEQRAIRGFVYAGDLEGAQNMGQHMQVEAEDIAHRMQERAEVNRFVANAALMAFAIGTSFIPGAGPFVSGAIFTGISIDQIATEYRRDGHASSESWVMLGITVATMGFTGATGALERAAVMAEDATSAARLLSASRGFAYANMGIGVFMMESGGVQAVQTYEAYTEGRAHGRDVVLAAAMAIFPVAHATYGMVRGGRSGRTGSGVSEALDAAGVERAPEIPATPEPPVARPEGGGATSMDAVTSRGTEGAVSETAPALEHAAEEAVAALHGSGRRSPVMATLEALHAAEATEELAAAFDSVIPAGERADEAQRGEAATRIVIAAERIVMAGQRGEPVPEGISGPLRAAAEQLAGDPAFLRSIEVLDRLVMNESHQAERAAARVEQMRMALEEARGLPEIATAVRPEGALSVESMRQTLALREMAVDIRGNFDQAEYQGQERVRALATELDRVARSDAPTADMPEDIRSAVQMIREAPPMTQLDRYRFIAEVALFHDMIAQADDGLGAALRQTMGAPEAEAATGRFRQFMAGRLLEIARLPAQERMGAIGDFRTAMDHALARALEDPQRTGSWMDFIISNPDVDTLAALARSHIAPTLEGVELSSINANPQQAEWVRAVAEARGQAGATPASILRSVIERIPEEWFVELSQRERLLGSLGGGWRGFYEAMAGANEALNSHGLAIYGNMEALGLYRARAFATSNEWGLTRGVMLEPLESVDPLRDNIAVYHGGMERIFLHATSEEFTDFGESISGETAVRVIYLHETQHLFDDATNFLELGRSVSDPARGQARSTVDRDVLGLLDQGRTPQEIGTYLRGVMNSPERPMPERMRAWRLMDHLDRLDSGAQPGWRGGTVDSLRQFVAAHITELGRSDFSESTTVARETMQLLEEGMSGPDIARHLEQRAGTPDELSPYRVGAEEVMAYLDANEPGWRTRSDASGLREAIATHIDELYERVVGMSLTELLGSYGEWNPSLAEEMARLHGSGEVAPEQRGTRIIELPPELRRRLGAPTESSPGPAPEHAETSGPLPQSEAHAGPPPDTVAHEQEPELAAAMRAQRAEPTVPSEVTGHIHGPLTLRQTEFLALLDATMIPEEVRRDLIMISDVEHMTTSEFGAFSDMVENKISIIDSTTGGDRAVMTRRGLNYFDSPEVLLMDLAEITRRSQMALPPEPVRPAETAPDVRDISNDSINRVFSTSDVQTVLEELGFGNAERTKEWHMRHPDGRTATFPDSGEIPGGTLSSMLRDIGITRRQFVEAAERSGVLSERRAREILNR